jgi:hypothetical protein
MYSSLPGGTTGRTAFSVGPSSLNNSHRRRANSLAAPSARCRRAHSYPYNSANSQYNSLNSSILNVSILYHPILFVTVHPWVIRRRPVEVQPNGPPPFPQRYRVTANRAESTLLMRFFEPGPCPEPSDGVQSTLHDSIRGGIKCCAIIARLEWLQCFHTPGYPFPRHSQMTQDIF